MSHYNARAERERRERDTKDRIVELARGRGYFSVSLRYRDDWLRARCAQLVKEGLLKGGSREGRHLIYYPRSTSMKLYIANGQFMKRKDEAKKLDKDFVETEVPVQQDGLIAYLNSMVDSLTAKATDGQAQAQVPKAADGPLERSPTLDERFRTAPLTHQLELAVGALDEACSLLRTVRLDQLPAASPTTASPAKTEDDADDLVGAPVIVEDDGDDLV